MKKKLCLFMCLVIIVTVFASVAFARKESCSYCGADMKCYDKSNEYVVRRYMVQCEKNPNRKDLATVLGTDSFYKCSNSACGIESFIDTKTRTVYSCGH
jgi:hypothetical protein